MYVYMDTIPIVPQRFTCHCNTTRVTSENRRSVDLVIPLQACRSLHLGLGQSRRLRLQRFGYLMTYVWLEKTHEKCTKRI